MSTSRAKWLSCRAICNLVDRLQSHQIHERDVGVSGCLSRHSSRRSATGGMNSIRCMSLTKRRKKTMVDVLTIAEVRRPFQRFVLSFPLVNTLIGTDCPPTSGEYIPIYLVPESPPHCEANVLWSLPNNYISIGDNRKMKETALSCYLSAIFALRRQFVSNTTPAPPACRYACLEDHDTRLASFNHAWHLVRTDG